VTVQVGAGDAGYGDSPGVHEQVSLLTLYLVLGFRQVI
jgi:hypothetical protein